MNYKKEKIEIPKQLDEVVNKAIYDGLSTPLKKKEGLKIFGGTALTLFIVFVTFLNTVPVFAKTMYEIDIIGDICKVFTFREYHFEDEYEYIDVSIPHIDLNGNDDLENRVNLEISKLIDEEVEASKTRAKEYYDAFIDTGGNPEDFYPIYVNINYEIKHLSDKFASFVINKSETLASAYNIGYYYNIDLETGRILNLQDIFGSDYQKIIADDIDKQISKMDKDFQDALLIDGSVIDYIDEFQEFYINDEGQIVIVFPKYEISVGALGTLEFVIEGE